MIDLAQKVRFLSDPSSYPHATASVEARETHMSWVFLTDDRVYKLKNASVTAYCIPKDYVAYYVKFQLSNTW